MYTKIAIIGGSGVVIRALLACLLAFPVAAQEYVVTDGALSDDDFYRVVACAAHPGGPCGEQIVRWADRPVTVAFAPISASYPRALAQKLDAALDTSITQIGAAAPGLTLRRVSKARTPHVRIHLQPIRAGELISGTGVVDMDGTPIGAAQVQVFWNGNQALTDATIVFAADIPLDQAGSIMLEELTQAMGLMTDIRNPYYNTRSVFSEDSNSVSKLGAQDRAALARHYPAQ